MDNTIIVAIIGSVSTVASSFITYYATKNSINKEKANTLIEINRKLFEDQYTNVIEVLYNKSFISSYKLESLKGYLSSRIKFNLLFDDRDFHKVSEIIYKNTQLVPNDIMIAYTELSSKFFKYERWRKDRTQYKIPFSMRHYYCEESTLTKFQRRFIKAVRKNYKCYREKLGYDIMR